ncbi:hypothetical protein Hanom_Chr16g01436541 [Helianthus anomalus]
MGFFLPENSLFNLERHGGEGREGERFLTRESFHIPTLSVMVKQYSMTKSQS